MVKICLSLFGALALTAGVACAQSGTPTIVVDQFTAKTGVDWPYDFKLLQTEMVEKIKKKAGDKAMIVAAAAPTASDKIYKLDGEITRMFQRNDLDGHSGGVSSNTDVVSVHYWLTDPSGKKVFDTSSTYDTLATASYSDAVFGTSGPMARDLESDIVGKINGAKIY